MFFFPSLKSAQPHYTFIRGRQQQRLFLVLVVIVGIFSHLSGHFIRKCFLVPLEYLACQTNNAAIYMRPPYNFLLAATYIKLLTVR
jgi:hypothetical protein